MRRRCPHAIVVALLALVVWMLPGVAHAQSRTAQLATQLKSNDDYRVRTQAALALGATSDDAAVKPLCGGLDDSNVSVKVAAAAALGKLGKPAGVACLKAAGAKESTPAVKSQIEKSIASLQTPGGSAPTSGPPPPGSDTKVYVAIQVTNKTSRPAAEIEEIVRSATQARVLSKSGYAVAPKGETPAQGGQIVKGKNLKGFSLIVTVEPPVYAGGNLTQIVRVTMLTYPGKDLKAEFAPKLTQESTPKGDTQSENLLMKLCIENAVSSFHKVAASL